MNIVFRVDSSDKMGVGHIMRCLALAESLLLRGANVSFVCRQHVGNYIDLLQKKAIPVKVLPAKVLTNSVYCEDYAAWLGATQIEDAEQTIEALKDGVKLDWLVVDHYGIDIEWEQCLRPYVDKLMVIDDLANRHHDCDVLLDQNYFAEGECRYFGLVPESCKLLIGPRYALLRPEYAAYRKVFPHYAGKVKRVLVFYGGSDPQNMTGMALEALSHPDLRHLVVDVVVGSNNSHYRSLEQQVLQRPFTTLLEPRPHLADLMVNADLALGAGGITTWERMCLGLPTVVTTIAENQYPGAEALAAVKQIEYAGRASEVTAESLLKAIIKLISNHRRLIAFSTQNQLTVDGFGTARAIEVMLPTDIAEIRLRAANREDVITYFNWANDPEVRKSAIQGSVISLETHKEWFTSKLNDSNSHLFVLVAANLPVGQIRFDMEGNVARIDYSLDKLVRGRGWGAKLVSLGVDMLQKIEPMKLLAEVKVSNKASKLVFLRLGFTIAESKGDYLIFHYNLENIRHKECKDERQQR